MSNPIGIDLGTTYSCVGVFRGKIEIIPNELGTRTTPSVVAFTPQERLVGDAAKNNITKNVENTIYDAKRLIGRRFDDPIVQRDKKLWPFKLEKEPNSDRPQYVIQYKGETKRYFPEQISAMILEKLKKNAEDFLGNPVEKAIITVPAYFNDSQRQATKDAGKIAGLKVQRVMNEPTAAAIAYGLETNCKGPKNILVFDFGGGTLDISILKIENSKYKVLAVSGDTHLGGEDIDNILTNYLIKEFEEKTGVNVSNNKKALRRLKVAAEKAKRELSFSIEAQIDIDSLAEGEDLNLSISRIDFENLCEEIFNKLEKPLNDAIEDSKLTRYDIEDLVLIGGSSRIPKVAEILIDYFHKDILSRSISPDEAIAYGAAVTASLMNDINDNEDDEIFVSNNPNYNSDILNNNGNNSNNKHKEVKDDKDDKEDKNEGVSKIEFIDATPLSLGIETLGGNMQVIIPRNTSIPCKRSKTFSTARDNQTSFMVEVFEGERKLTKDNHKLGQIRITGLEKKPKGQIIIKIIFIIDKNGILNVQVQTDDMDNGNLVIKNDKGRLSKEEIERLILEAESLKKDDLIRSKEIEARVKLEQFSLNIKQEILSGKLKNNLGEVNKKVLLDKIEAISHWLKANKILNIKEIEEKYNDLETVYKNAQKTPY